VSGIAPFDIDTFNDQNAFGFPSFRPSRDASERRRLRAAVEGAKAGDNEAIRYLYVRHAADVNRYVRAIVHDHHEAEDITQAVFTKLFRTISKYEPREVPFSAWIKRVARNLAVDEMRRRRRAGWGESGVIEASSDEGDAERLQSLLAALNGLPRDQRRVLLLRHICGLAPSEIASRLGKSESSVHGLHHRARGALCRTLTDLEATPTTAHRSPSGEIAEGSAA
jgi:RNA polymerase sigma-70 factor, ECF subfamily